MVKNLYELFGCDFSDIENRSIDLIKRVWVLLCVWIGDNLFTYISQKLFSDLVVPDADLW